MGDCGQVKWISNHDHQVSSSRYDVASKASNPKYSILGERLRSVTPATLQCSVFCGGRHCKYCNPVVKFKKEDMVIYGLYSAWVTESILATSRPSSEAIKQYDIIGQFHSNGITSIINLQHAGEHISCGFGLETSGFSYNPEEFMENNIFFYNFGWNDYGVRSLQSILDMVQVMDFAITNGKAAVHCHAGLGRTGVLIACYIIYSKRCSATEAICLVRKTRPRSIQTRGQINCVKDFATYIKPMWVIFTDGEAPVSLQHFLNRQRRMLHGEEAKTLRYVPKIVFTILQRLLVLAGSDYDLTKCVKVTHHNIMKTSSFNSPPPQTTEFAKSAEISQSETDCTKTNDDNLLLRKENTEILVSRTVHKELELVKATSMPNVSITTETEDILAMGGSPRLLKPLKLKPAKRKKKELRKRLMQLDENSDIDSLASSFNSYLDPDMSLSLSLSSSFDSTAFYREGSMVSDTSLLSETSNEGSNGGGSRCASNEVVKYLAYRSSDIVVHNQVDRYKHKLNNGRDGWNELLEETNMAVLSSLLWSWLKSLQVPIISVQQIEVMKSRISEPLKAGEEVQKVVWKLIEAYVTCLSKLNGRNEDINRAIRRFAVAVTGDESIPRIRTFQPKEEMELDGNETHARILFKFLLSFLHTLKSN